MMLKANSSIATVSVDWPNTSTDVGQNYTESNMVFPSDNVLRLLDFVTVMLLIIIILSAGGHIVVIICIYKDKTLRTIFNCYVVALSLADCLISLIAAPIHLGQMMAKGPTHEAWCKIKTTAATFSIMYSLSSMAVIAAIRLHSVVRPFKRYKRWVVHLAIFIQTILSSIANGLTFGTPSLMFPCQMTYLAKSKETVQMFYHLFGLEFRKISVRNTWLLVPIAAVVSFVVSIAFYTVIFCSLRSRRSIGTAPTDTNNSETNQGVAEAVPTTTTGVTASVTLQKADILTLKTALILTMMFFVSYIPSFVVGFIFLGSSFGAGYLYPLVTSLMYLHCILNPIIYMWTSSKFKASFRKLMSRNGNPPVEAVS